MMAFNIVKRKAFISIHRERERVNNNKLKKIGIQTQVLISTRFSISLSEIKIFL
jgi:hypothetical protein